MASLKINGPIQLQPMQLGAHYFCVAAKFGIHDILKTGFENNEKDYDSGIAEDEEPAYEEPI